MVAEGAVVKLEDARVLAELWMEHHGLRGWRFAFDNAARRCGYCDGRRRVISLSRPYVEMNDEAEVEDTILHEIAHALAPEGEHHGPRWRAIAARIGASPVRCAGEEVRMPPPPFIGKCPACQREIRRHRRRNISCGRCSPRYDARYRFEWRRA